MGSIAALLPESGARARLAAATTSGTSDRAEHHVALAETWPELHTAARAAPLHVLVFDPYARGTFDGESCTGFHERFPSVVLVPYTRFYGRPANDILRLAQLGIRRVVSRDEDDSPPQLCIFLREAVAEGCSCRIAAELADVLSPELAAFLNHLAAGVNGARDPDTVARAYFCHPKTLRDRLRSAGLPPTNKLIIWGRLLRAACLLEESGRSVEAVALALDFPSSSALHKQLRRYTGLGTRDVALPGGLGRVAAEFRAHLRLPRQAAAAAAGGSAES
jgi:AraC-like DNA-binding protein